MHVLVCIHVFASYAYTTAYMHIYKYVKKHIKEVFNFCIDNS